jgi:1-deoxy-D-xylulose-5-phosphate synthase
MILAAPLDEIELRNLMFTASEGLEHPIAIRYPRGRGENTHWQQPFEKISIGKSKMLQEGSKVAVVSTGTIGTNVTNAFAQLENKSLFSHYHFPFIKPLDSACIDQIIDTHEVIITVEDGVIKGGFGAQINSIVALQNKKLSIINLGIPDVFIEQGTVLEQQQFCNIDVLSLLELFNTLSHD